MMIVTGGSGFIGSAVVWRLNKAGIKDVLVVDHLGNSGKWRNLVGLAFDDYLDKNVFIEKLEAGVFADSVDAIIHMGACSSTTEVNADYLMENNYRYTVRLASWVNEHPKCRFIYASSAATYGDGSLGYSDDEENLPKIRPMNMYGYSKHLFDLLARREGWLTKIVGLKFFNVFGPNEQHKGDMRSVISKAYPCIRKEGKMSLFKSYNPDFKDGEQKRDFIYIKDVVEVIMSFLERRDVNGLFNAGSGVARSWNDLAASVFKAVNKPVNIAYIDMPETLRDKYQYFTCADISKLNKTGYSKRFHSLEDAVDDYVHNYLIPDKNLV